MGFNTQFSTTYRWRQNSGVGLEHLHINSCENNIIIASVAIGEDAGQQFGVKYTIICASDWRVRSFKIENTQGQDLVLNSDGEGNWYSQDGSSRSGFSGAIDIDLCGTPFTSTLPIRRLDKHQKGYSQRFKVLYIPIDTFEPRLDRQQYSCLKPYSRYRYEPLARNFSTELEVDNNGVVLNYPEMFTQI
ncbi:MAG: putative glycolipid-binding domain-containing protein [Hyphomicrobiales bacterium]|nr:putative glycolipid-binding domain-containing protein [Hyphomicrobiales bacterium]